MRDELSQERICEIADEALARIDQHSRKVVGKIEIPKRLQDPAFRFILVDRQSKKPSEEGWPMYPYNHPRLLDHLIRGGNYGVRPGEGRLCILDADNPGRLQEVGVLPAFDGTFFVSNRTDGRGHYYFLCENPPWKKLVLQDPEKTDERGEHLHLGELFAGKGLYQVVGPGSIHPEGRRYDVRNDVPLREFTFEELEKLFAFFVQREIPAESARKYRLEKRGTLTDRLGLRVEDYLMPDNPMRQGDEIQGVHPVHGSDTGMNLRIDTSRGIWHCFRHRSGGDALLALAVREGIIQCEEAAPGALQDAKRMGEVHKALVRRGLVKEDAGTGARRYPPGSAAAVVDTALFEPTKGGGVKPWYENIAAMIQAEMRIISWGGSLFPYNEVSGIYTMNRGEVEARIQDVLNVGGYDGSITHATSELIHRLTYADPAMDYPFNHERDLIPVANGVLKIDPVAGSVVLLPLSPEYRFTYRLPILYDGAAPAAPVEAVLRQWVSEENLPILLQVSAQAILQSAGLVYKKAYIFEGDHDAGKSTYLLLLERFFGEENLAGVDLRAICEDRFALSNLERKLINVYDDLGSFPIRYVGKFKAVTGKITHRMERKGKDAYDGVITATHIFTCNEPPRIKEIADDAFWRRWEYVDFPNSFPLDPVWAAHTFTPAFLSGYLNMVVQALVRILRGGGLLVDSSPEVVKDRWVRAADPLAGFMVEKTIRADGFYICHSVFYERYVGWCKENEKKVDSKNRVTRLLGTMGYHTVQKRPQGKQEKVYVGMRWGDGSWVNCQAPPDRPEAPLASPSP